MSDYALLILIWSKNYQYRNFFFMVNVPSVFFVVVLICFCSVLFCLFVLIYYLFIFFPGGGGGQHPSSFYTQPPSGFLSFVEEISL